MAAKIFTVVLMLCTSLISYAQVEQEAQKLAETQHKALASELSSALTQGRGKPVFGREGKTDKQFFLADDQQTFTDFFGWKQKQYDKRTLLSVYKYMLGATKTKNTDKQISVDISFPFNGVSFEGQAQNKAGKDIKDLYVVTTNADVTVEADKNGLNSVAKNSLTLNWEVFIKINKKGVIDARGSRAVLRSISVEEATGLFASEKQQIQTVADKLIKDYYQALTAGRWSSIEIPEEWKNILQASPKRETEGTVIVSTPNSASFNVRNVPTLNIYVDQNAYHKVALAFDIAVDDDLKTGRITGVEYSELEKPKIVAVAAPEPQVVEPEPVKQPEPVKTAEPGIRYKVQILSLSQYIELAGLSPQYRIDNITVEKYNVGGTAYYRYMVPAGTSLQEALSVRKQMLDRGIADAWIAVYENGNRIRPNEGQPEIIR